MTRYRDRNRAADKDMVRGERRAVPGSHPEGAASEEGWGVGGDEVLVQHIVQQGGDVQGRLGLLSLHLQNGLRHRPHCQQGCFTQAPPFTVPRGLSDSINTDHPAFFTRCVCVSALAQAGGLLFFRLCVFGVLAANEAAGSRHPPVALTEACRASQCVCSSQRLCSYCGWMCCSDLDALTATPEAFFYA